MKEYRGKVPVPVWMFVAAAVVFDELLLQLWVSRALAGSRLLTFFLFALAFGLLLALPVSCLRKPETGKWIAVAAAALLAVVYFAMYLIWDTYRSFLTPVTIISGAGGVASDYLTLALTAIFRNIWRLGVLAAPVAAYGFFCGNVETAGLFRGVLAAGCVLFYLLGFSAAQLQMSDQALLGSAYHFDGAVRAFGLQMGMTLEAAQSFSAAAEEPEFLPAEETAPAQTQEPRQSPAVYEPQILPLDFASLAQSETNSSVAALHRYVAEQKPSTRNEFTGLFAGKNLIFITAEAFSPQVIDPQRTPTLHRLATRGIRFEEYYQPAWGGSTTGGEFSNLTGLVPVGGGSCMKEAIEQDLFLTIGSCLQARGYHSAAYHNHSHTYYNRDETHTRLGYDTFVAMGNGMEAGVRGSVPESDLEMMEFTVPQFIGRQPFSIYYMTMSGHALYSRGGNAMSHKNYHRVEALPYPEVVKCYLAANLELEDAMASLVLQLEKAGLTDDTVIVLAADHYPYALEKSNAWGNDRNYLKDLYGVEQVDCFQRDRSALIIWSGSIEDEAITVEEPVYSLDILPTLLNLFDIPFDSRLLVGRDVFSEVPPLVLWPDHSWRTARGFYNAATGEYKAAEGAAPEEAYCAKISAAVANKLTYCESVCALDYFNTLAGLLK